jgi:hypothetical protein
MEEIRKIASDLGNRIKGTYGATFVLVWLVYNWRFIYILLSFDKSYTLPHKMEVLNKYVEKYSYCYMFWYPLGMSVLSIVGYYLMNYLTFAISAIFNLRLKPWIQDNIDKIKSTVVSIDLYKKLLKQHKELENVYNNENQDNVKIKALLEDKNKEIINLEQSYTTLNTIKENLEKNNKEKIQELMNSRGYTNVNPNLIFSGKWKNFYSEIDNSKVNGVEYFHLSLDEYITTDKTKFILHDFQINSKNVEFKKNMNNKRIIDCNLIIVDENHLIGFEYDHLKKYIVDYKRVSEEEYLNNLNKASNTNINKKLNL